MIKPRRRRQLIKRVTNPRMSAKLVNHPDLESAPRRWELLLRSIDKGQEGYRHELFYQAGELLYHDITYLKDIIKELEVVENKYGQEINAAIREEKGIDVTEAKMAWRLFVNYIHPFRTNIPPFGGTNVPASPR